MSITYYSIAKNIFAASTGKIDALKSFSQPHWQTWTMQITPALRVIGSHNKLIAATASGV